MSNCPVCNLRKTAVIENWTAVDHVIFGKNEPKRILVKEEYNNYKKLKSCMLLNLFELYKHVNYVGGNMYENITEMENRSLEKAKIALAKSKALVESQEVKSHILENVSQDEKKKIFIENVLKTSIDFLLFESSFSDILKIRENDMKGNLLIQAHKDFRNKIIQMSFKKN